jgi:hypothetical protein
VASVTDNPGNNSTDIVFSGGGGSGGGQYNVTLANGVNSNVNTNGHQSVIYVGGPTAAFSIDGFDHAPAAGEQITVVNTTAFNMSAAVDTGSTSGQRVAVIGTTSVANQVRPGGFMQFTGNASPATGPTVWLLTHIGYYRTDEVNPLDYNCKFDGTTIDSANLQATVNDAVNTGKMVIRVPAGTAALNVPLFTGGNPIQFEGVPGSFTTPVSVFRVTNTQMCPVVASHGQLTDYVYGTESGISYAEIGLASAGGGAQGINIGQTPCSSINGWGGSTTATVASYTQPPQLTPLTVTMSPNTSEFSSSGGLCYVPGGGLYIYTVIDSTHLSLELLDPVPASVAGTGSTVTGGVGINLSSGPGFTFECFIDPVTSLADGGLAYIASSVGYNMGARVAFPNHSAFQLFLYNDQVTAQNRLEFQLTTTGGTATLKSGTSTIANGALTHIAAVYDGYSTVSLYIAGTRVATASLTGAIVQEWWETFMIGPYNYANFPNYNLFNLNQIIHLAGIRLTSCAMYSGSSFTPPTAPPTFVPRMLGFSIDFAPAFRPNITGPGGVNIALGWIIGTGASPQVNANGVPMWFTSVSANALGYVASPIFRNMGIINYGFGPAYYTWSSLYGKATNCVFGSSGPVAILHDGFSYLNTYTDCYASASGTFANGLSGAFCVLYGSQYCTWARGKIEGGAWNVIANCYAGFALEGAIWFETSGRGTILASGSASPSFSIKNCFVQDDLGWQGLPLVAAVVCIGIINVTIESGYLGQQIGGQNDCPSLIFDSCQNVRINGAGIAPQYNSVAGTILGQIQIYNPILNTPVIVSAAQLSADPAPIPFAFTLTNGSPTVGVAATANLTPNQNIVFAAQPNTVYTVGAITSSTSFQISPSYSGPNSSVNIATLLGHPWMPSNGSPGQGPLIIDAQERFGINIVNMIAASGMTLKINDFLWKVIQITDANTLLTGAVQVTLPLIAGYQRTFINSTAQTLTFGGATGNTMSAAPGGHVNGACDGTNWIVTS